MAYAGGLAQELASAQAGLVYAFLRRALLAAPASLPLRGPAELDDAGWRYRCAAEGTIDRSHVHGAETFPATRT